LRILPSGWCLGTLFTQGLSGISRRKECGGRGWSSGSDERIDLSESFFELESVRKLRDFPKIVIPAKAGIQAFHDVPDAGSSPA
jgi:hypothetical protein